LTESDGSAREVVPAVNVTGSLQVAINPALLLPLLEAIGANTVRISRAEAQGRQPLRLDSLDLTNAFALLAPRA
jgi:hypothetical protein